MNAKRLQADGAFVATLSAREREVARLLATGAQKLAIARQLSISPCTVEIHKARRVEKLGACSVADLVRIADLTRLRDRDHSLHA